MNANDVGVEVQVLRVALQETSAQRDSALLIIKSMRELAKKYVEWKGTTDPISPLHGAGMARGFQFAGKELLEILDQGKS